jgi:hypothetical protein
VPFGPVSFVTWRPSNGSRFAGSSGACTRATAQ